MAAGDAGGIRPKPVNLDTKSGLHADFDGQAVTLQTQAIAGVKVDGSFLKTLSQGDNLVWAKARHIKGFELPSEASVQAELKRLPQVREKTDPFATRLGCEWKGEIVPQLRYNLSRWSLVFKRHCETKDGRLWELTLNPRGGLIKKQKVGSHFAWEEVPVTIFPKGPKNSQLQPLRISISAQPYFLSTPNLEVLSDAGFKFPDTQQISSVRPTDGRFDMVEAYYYSSEALKWVHENLKFQLPKLKIRTHVGHPDKSNVAFYFSREVRLGSGDDIAFSKIPWDPSIVMHETMHAVIEALTGLPFQGEGGSLQEALADFLTAHQLDNPRMGESAYKKVNFSARSRP
ncbi:MAG: M4 family metallopeptidase [Calothrix sp. SM1_5_4]|nr:M4 family metallopeptidase [Calothrix sp. SM1_5_4]